MRADAGSSSGINPDADIEVTGSWKFNRTMRIGTTKGVRLAEDDLEQGTAGVAVGKGVPGGHGTTVGHNAGRNNNISRLTAFGEQAGSVSSGRVTALGYRAGASAKTSTFTGHLTAIGYQAGNSADGEGLVFLGQNAGNGLVDDNRLLIHSSDDLNLSESLTDALIDGRFRAGTGYRKGVKINGDLETTDELVIRSPDGSRWRITVDDAGGLSAVVATEPV